MMAGTLTCLPRWALPAACCLAMVTCRHAGASRAAENPQSTVRNPQSAILNPQSSILNPQSSIRNPQSNDWPTYRHDNRRSGATPEKLALPLAKAWTHAPAAGPRPAWTGPAKWDAFAGIKGLRSMRDFDTAFHVTVAGGRAYFGSSADDAAHCLDAATGRQQWAYCTDGPVRLPPTLHESKAYFGSDDGSAYCVRADDGALVWKRKAAPDGRLIPSNAKLISLWPVRTGVLVAGSRAYFGASLLPWRASVLWAVDARSGAAAGAGSYRAEQADVTMQGAMLASARNLYVPQGRSAPLVYSRADGKALGAVRGGGGGTYAILTEAAELIHGPGNKAGWLSVHGQTGRDQFLTFPDARRMVVAARAAYLQQAATLAAFDHVRYFELGRQIHDRSRRQGEARKQLKKLGKTGDPARRAELDRQIAAIAAEIKRLREAAARCYLWKVPCPPCHSLIAAGELLIAGGSGHVRAYAAADGREVWAAAIEGKAHGLAAAGGRLYVSTDTGEIHCFVGRGPGRAQSTKGDDR